METVHRMFIRAGLLLCLAASGSSFRCERENSWGWTQIFQCPEAGDDPDKLFCCGFGDNKYCCSTAVDEDLIEEFFDQVPSVPLPLALPLAQVQTDPVVSGSTKQGGVAKLNHTMMATKDKVKTAITGRVMDSKDKLKAKINSTVTNVKDKVKQKVKDKVKEKAKQKLDPTGGHLPTVLAIIGGIIVTVIVLCIVCCCCCPFCLLYKHRNRGTVHNPNPEVSVMQPLQTQSQTYPPPQQQPPYPAQPMPMHPSQAGYPPQPYPPAGYPPQPYPPTGYPNEQPPMYTEKQPPPYNPTY